MTLSAIEPLAQLLLDQLSSACVRLIVAGSIRRRKPEPHDIELVAIPALGLAWLEPAERTISRLDSGRVTG